MLISSIPDKQSQLHSPLRDNSSDPLPTEPREYIPDPKEPRFTFKHFYIQYARFHSDESNILIHLVFVPIISFSVFGLVEL